MKRKIISIAILGLLTSSAYGSAAAAAIAASVAGNTTRMILQRNRDASSYEVTIRPNTTTSRQYIEDSKNFKYIEDKFGDIIGTVKDPYIYGLLFNLINIQFGVVDADEDIFYLELDGVNFQPKYIKIEGSPNSYTIEAYHSERFNKDYRFKNQRFLFRVESLDKFIISGDSSVTLILCDDSGKRKTYKLYRRR